MPVKVLDKHVAELIAAGEVVERPSSVIKELVENSIDAGATTITVEIKNGGITYMRITDDGCGIPFDEVPIAFLRHATSKVSTEIDLTKIGTLGFRGEALASVAAVAKVDMLTAVDGSYGTAYSIHGGEEVSHTEAGCPKGTTIIVRDLFYNTPARMKFLKKDTSEANSVAGVIDRMALSHPEISFRFIRDGKQVLSTSGKGGIEAAAYAVYGREFSGGMLGLDYTVGGIKVSGLVCKPSEARKSRSMQHFFINGRYVKSKTMMAALEQAYKGSIMVGRFPSCVMYMTIPCGDVDINVHPAKIECRFVNEKAVFDAVYYGVKDTLQKDNIRQDIKLPASPVQSEAVRSKPFRSVYSTGSEASAQLGLHNMNLNVVQSIAPAVRTQEKPVQSSAVSEKAAPLAPMPKFGVTSGYARVSTPAETYQSFSSKPDAQILSEPESKAVDQPEYNMHQTLEPEVDIKLVGEAFNTYAIAENGDELIIIDKHAAHERMLYEQLRSSENNDPQLLLEPEAVTLSKEECTALLDNMDKISQTGFELEEFGNGCLLVRAVPAILSDCDVKQLVTEIAAGFIEHKNSVEIDHLDWLYHNMACRAAVKGGDRSGEDLLVIAKRIAGSDDIRYCPHGRPVAFRLTLKELEKQFGRQG